MQKTLCKVVHYNLSSLCPPSDNTSWQKHTGFSAGKKWHFLFTGERFCVCVCGEGDWERIV